jgi:hypothetical protein
VVIESAHYFCYSIIDGKYLGQIHAVFKAKMDENLYLKRGTHESEPWSFTEMALGPMLHTAAGLAGGSAGSCSHQETPCAC